MKATLMFLALMLAVAGPAAAQQHNHPDPALQERGRIHMGVDQYTSTHVFDDLADGGRIELQRSPSDTAGVRTIREHLQTIAKAFKAGDFTIPGLVHAQAVPGVEVLAARRAAITYTYRPLPGGGEVRIRTKDKQALRAIHEFLAFQREDHHAGGKSAHQHDH